MTQVLHHTIAGEVLTVGVAAHVTVEAAVGVVIVARSDEEVMALLGSGDPLDNARQLFSSWSARIETLSVQRTPLSSIIYS